MQHFAGGDGSLLAEPGRTARSGAAPGIGRDSALGIALHSSFDAEMLARVIRLGRVRATRGDEGRCWGRGRWGRAHGAAERRRARRPGGRRHAGREPYPTRGGSAQVRGRLRGRAGLARGLPPNCGAGGARTGADGAVRAPRMRRRARRPGGRRYAGREPYPTKGGGAQVGGPAPRLRRMTAEDGYPTIFGAGPRRWPRAGLGSLRRVTAGDGYPTFTSPRGTAVADAANAVGRAGTPTGRATARRAEPYPTRGGGAQARGRLCGCGE